jgi:hypothetical protein
VCNTLDPVLNGVCDVGHNLHATKTQTQISSHTGGGEAHTAHSQWGLPVARLHHAGMSRLLTEQA